MSSPVKFAYVGKVLDKISAAEAVAKFNESIPITVEYLESVEELFPLLSNAYYHTDYINIVCVIISITKQGEKFLH